jgi:hypothetical protein
MIRNRCVMACGALAVVALAGPAPAGPNDWPGWGGPNRDGVSPETGLLKEWPEGGPKLLWKVKGMGEGYSTPSVADGRIYLMGSKGGSEYTLALDEKDGSEVWSAKVGPVAKDGPPSYPGPRCTPTVDGDRIYALGSDGDLVCLDKGGKEVWKKNLSKDLAGNRGKWAYAESPLIDGDVVVCTPGGAKASLAALNKKTGETVWTSVVPGGGEAAYASAIVAEAGGVKQYVQFLRNGLVGVAAKDGKFLWLYGKLSVSTNCCTPVFHDGHVFASNSGNGGSIGCALLKLNAEGAPTEVYFNNVLQNHHGGVVRVGDSVFGTNNQVLICMDWKTGKSNWTDRAVGKGSVSAADGHLYVRGEKSGQVVLVEATPAGYKQTGKLDQPDRGKRNAWCHPVIANGKLYLRDDDLLLCYDIKAK